MAKTTTKPSTLQGSKARLRTAQELLAELNPMMRNLCGTAAAIGIVTRALGEPNGDEDAYPAMLSLADILQHDAERIDRLYTQALEASWGFAPKQNKKWTER
jgi:hypothetical protein